VMANKNKERIFLFIISIVYFSMVHVILTELSNDIGVEYFTSLSVFISMIAIFFIIFKNIMGI